MSSKVIGKTATHIRCNCQKLAAIIVVAFVMSFPACDWFRDFNFERGAKLTGGDPQMGRKQLGMHSCVSCHVIPGVPKADGTKGPSLEHWYRRRTFLNTYPNTPENMEKWLARPSHRKPGTTMPDLNVSAQESRDMTAYLFSIN
ncbi:MAG: c-type cytochrome [Terriglobales bacterium]